MKLNVTIVIVVAVYVCLVKNGLRASTLLPLTTKVKTRKNESAESNFAPSSAKNEPDAHTLLPIITEITTADKDNDTRASTIELTKSCVIAKSIFMVELGDGGNSYVYNNEQTGTPLKVCRNTKTCCMPQAEKRLHKRSEEQLKGDTRPLHIDLQKFGRTQATFKRLFRNILKKSYTNLDTMFQRTYKDRYQKNSYVFQSLYRSLNQYFNGSELDLQDSVDSFFEKLFEKIYIMSKPWQVFNKKYQHCIFESTNFVKPFGDIQRKVAHQILRSFLASRVFLVGLREGTEFATQMLRLRLGDGCLNAFMKMTQCSVCSGVPRSVKPCKKYCINVIKGCYVDTIIVQGMWNQFIDAMVALTSKIEGPFSMEAVIEPLGVKISEAIMAFQDDTVNITNKVQERCGLPPLAPNIGGNERRRKRRAESSLPVGLEESKKFFAKKFYSELKAGTQKSINTSKTEGESSLPFLFNFNVNNQKAASEFEKMLGETKASLAGLKDYWVKLSERWCNEARTTTDNAKCWNGRNTSGYHLDVVSDLVKDSENNPEVETEQQNKNLILDQVSILERSIKLIKSALIGNTEQCVDSECDSSSGDGGSGDGGSGDGSGMKEDASGSGELTSIPLENNCANSVTGDDCIDTIEGTTGVPDNDIPYVPVRNPPQWRSTQNKSYVYAGSVLLLLLCNFVAVIL